MREFTAAALIAAALIATDARAEAWTYTDENGQEQNTDACPKQDCRDTPQPPKQIPGEKPKDRPTLKADKRDREPEQMETAPGYYCRLNGEVVNFRNAKGAAPAIVTRACPSYAHKVAKDGGVPGPFGPHEGGE